MSEAAEYERKILKMMDLIGEMDLIWKVRQAHNPEFSNIKIDYC